MRLPDGDLNPHSSEYVALVLATTPLGSISTREALCLYTGKPEEKIRNSITVVL
jgi:hypothetical protein